MRVSRIDHRGERPAFETHKGRVCPLGRALRIPATTGRRNAARLSACKQADDVNLMDGLTEDHAAALGRKQFLWPTWSIKEVGVVERLQHAHASQAAFLDQCKRLRDRPVKAVAWTDKKVNAGLRGDSDHCLAILHRHGQRLVDQNMFAGLGCGANMIRMHLMRCRYVDSLDGRVVTQRLYGFMGRSAKLCLKGAAGLGAWCGGSNQVEPTICKYAWQGQHEGATKPRNPKTQRAPLRGQ